LTGAILATPITQEHYELWNSSPIKSVFKDVKYGRDELENH